MSDFDSADSSSLNESKSAPSQVEVVSFLTVVAIIYLVFHTRANFEKTDDKVLEPREERTLSKESISKQINQLQRIQKIGRMIKSANTGSPKEFAVELGISESHFHRYIEELQEMGIPIHYSRARKTYYYENNTELSLSYSLKIISEHGAKEIIGGVNKIPSLLFYESVRTLL